MNKEKGWQHICCANLRKATMPVFGRRRRPIMKIEKVIKQLESILDHTRSMAASPDADEIWKEDSDALEFALTALRSMPEAGEPLSLEQLREVPHGKIKDSTLQNIANRANEIASPPAHIGREAWTAEWIEDGDCEHKPHRIRDVKKWRKYKCSKCGYKAGRSNSRNYCPSCGRAMTPEALAELERRLRG